MCYKSNLHLHETWSLLAHIGSDSCPKTVQTSKLGLFVTILVIKLQYNLLYDFRLFENEERSLSRDR